MKSQILTANLIILVSKIGVFYHNNITPNRKIRENWFEIPGGAWKIIGR